MGRPFLDVSDVLLDPVLAQTFQIKRRTETVGSNGRVSISEITHSSIGVICMASGNQLSRLDDSQRMGRHLSIVTKFRLQGPTEGKQPDLIYWEGDWFIVQDLDIYTQYGAGFIQAVVGSIDVMDQPPFTSPLGRLTFNQATQSGGIACL